MDAMWRTALSRQFEAAIDMLENALRACPDELWTESLWKVMPDHPGVWPSDHSAEDSARASDGAIQVFSAFWYLGYHVLFFMDLYLSGGFEQFEEGFAPPAPFTVEEHAPGVLPRRVYRRAELQGYLAYNRQKCKMTIEELTDEQARRPCRRARGDIPFAELLLANLRHVQQHGEQLSMFLGQKAGSASAWVDTV
jgi:hypothetical protein